MENVFGNWIARHLERWRWLLLLIGVVMGAASLPLSRTLRLDWQLDRMFPPGDALVESYHRLEDRFGGNEVVIAVYRDPELWNASGVGLERLAVVTEQLSKVDGVAAVLSLAELHRILEQMRAPLKLLRFGTAVESSTVPLLDKNDRLAQALLDVFAGYTHQRDSQFVAVACLLAPSKKTDSENAQPTKSSESLHATIDNLKAIIQSVEKPAGMGLIAGEPVMVVEGFQLVQRDGLRLGITSTILLTMVLFICFRSVRWTLIPLAIVHWSVVVTQAILVLLDLELTMVSSMLTAIVTVIGVATTMHLLLRYQDIRRRGASRNDALREALAALIVPIALACVTDAVGFISLMAANVGPVRDFGLMMAIGSLVVLLSILMLVPGLALIGKWDSDPHIPKSDLAVRMLLRKLLDAVLAHRRGGVIALLLVTVLALIGGARMQVETDFTKNFYASNPLVQGYRVVESELGGAGVWDIMLPAPKVISQEYLDEVLKLEQQLRGLEVASELTSEVDRGGGTTFKLTKVLSMADADQAAQVESLIAALPVRARLEGMRRAMPEFSQALLTFEPDEHELRWLRVMLRSREQTAASVKSQLIDQVNATVSAFTERPEWKALFTGTRVVQTPATVDLRGEVTGYHVMLSRLVSSVLEDQWKCFALASVGIFVIMLLATRSLLFSLAALVPNALPIIVVLGAMGWLGMRVNMGAAMIAAVSMGLSIDSSIHYLLHYQRRLKAGDRPLKALRSAQENVGFAVVLATVALIAGFLALAVSEFVPTVVFGTLTSLTMLGGLFGNLVVLPLLVAPRN